MRYKSKNNLDMFHTKYMNWQVSTKNRDNTGNEIFHVSIGPFMQMFEIEFEPKTGILSFTGYDSLSDLFKFKVTGITQANEYVRSFVKANNISFENSIYDPKFYKNN